MRACSYAGGSGRLKSFLGMRSLSWGLSNEQQLSVTGRDCKVLWLEGSCDQKEFHKTTWLKTGSVGVGRRAGSLRRQTQTLWSIKFHIKNLSLHLNNNEVCRALVVVL